jgi:hypothetical protein
VTESAGESLGEVRGVLAEVSERLRAAYRCVRSAEQGLDEAIAVLSRLDQSHHDNLVPPELPRASSELTRGLGLISGGVESVEAIDARL